ncbi:MAG: cytochrome c [Pseudomonadota bacterium]
MRSFLKWIAVLAVVGIAVFWFVTTPERLPDTALDGITGDPVRGELVFWAGGCASCHAAPGSEGDEKLVLAGGERFPSPFGTFVAPNISPDAENGIGGFSDLDFANAVIHGTTPNGSHYYPAFPYPSYSKATLQDVADLKAYMDALPESSTPSAPHEVGFPFNIRRTLGAWKFLYGAPDWQLDPVSDEAVERGRYLVEVWGHCGECHTDRDALGGLVRAAWLEGAPDPSGEGRVPGITPAELDWSAGDIAYYLETGFTPDFDSAGGHMARVVQSLANLPPEDRAAIAAYLQALP